MNWESIGAVGEIVSALGVIVTLIYLARQIRQNTLTTYANAYQSYTNSITATNLSIANDLELARLMTRLGTDPYESFDPADRMRWSHVILSHLRSLEGLYVQCVLGPTAVNAWEAQSVFVERFASWPAVRGFWFAEAIAWGWDEGFKAHVHRAMTDAQKRGQPGKAWGAA